MLCPSQKTLSSPNLTGLLSVKLHSCWDVSNVMAVDTNAAFGTFYNCETPPALRDFFCLRGRLRSWPNSSPSCIQLLPKALPTKGVKGISPPLDSESDPVIRFQWQNKIRHHGVPAMSLSCRKLHFFLLSGVSAIIIRMYSAPRKGKIQWSSKEDENYASIA